MLKIWVDLQEEYNILVHARCTANLRRKAKEGQHCFVEQDVECYDKLEYLIWQLQTKAPTKKEKGLVPIKISALSLEDLDYYHEQNNHYQVLANAYTDWYAGWHEISQNSISTYFYCVPLDVDFELPLGALKTTLVGFLNEAWFPGSTCVSKPAQDPLEQFLPNPCNHCWYSSRINECHHLDTILLTPIESYQASAPSQ